MQRRRKVYVKRKNKRLGERLIEISFFHYAIAKILKRKNVYAILTD